MYDLRYCSQQGNQIIDLSEPVIEKNISPNFRTVKDGIILPRKTDLKNAPYQGGGGVVSKNGSLVKESVIYDLINTNDQKQLLAFGYAYSASHIKVDSKKVIYLGLAHQHWGHFLVDVVQRLWFINENKKEFNSGKLENYWFAFAGFGNGVAEFKGNYSEFFRLFGLNTSQIIIVEEPTQFPEIIVPDIAIYPGQYIHTVFKNIFDCVVGSAMKEAGKKFLPTYQRIYFSRTHLKDNKEMGEEKIQDTLERCGYKILYPEELSLIEQIWYWRTADEIACINGSITHNCVFARPELRLNVFNKMSRIVGYQFTMDVVWGGMPVYISAYKEPFKNYPISVSRGPFWIAITVDVKKFFKSEYNIDIEGTNLWPDYVHYLFLCLVAKGKYIFRGSKVRVKKFINYVLRVSRTLKINKIVRH